MRLLPENAILSNEIMVRLRRRRTFAIVTLYSGLLAALVVLLWLGMGQQRNQSYGQAPFESTFGQTVFMTIMIAQLCLVCFLAPALTASCITGEKERRRFDLLATSLIGPAALAYGKLVSAMIHMGILISSSVPLVAVCFLFGGVSQLEVCEGYFVLVMTTLTLAAFGVFWSSRLRSTVMAVGFTYGIVFFFTIGTYLVTILMIVALGIRDKTYAMFALLLNPFMAMPAVVYGNEMFGQTWLPAPAWVITMAAYAVFCLFLALLTVHRLKHTMRQK